MRRVIVELMGVPFEHVTRCLDLQEDDVADALASRETTRALLAHLAAISAPNTGAAKVLIVFARMATTACDWIDGDLCIDVFSKADVTVIEAATELGGGLRERVFAPMSFKAPIAEFARAIDRVPHVIVPLVIRARSARRISLAATQALRRASGPPPRIEIASENLFVRESPPAARDETNAPAVPLPLTEDVDAGWED
ncbi:MAG: hypothetical protein M3O46_10595 [Myxococcota bacterium]|nr:hypothetical protein [Myxococcota bacterium]